MGSFSDYAELKVLDHIVGKTSFAMPTAWIALSTADPTDAGSGLAEPDTTGTAYARKLTDGTNWNAAADGTTSNADELSFVEATASWGTITHFALMDSSVVGSGNMLAHAALDTQKAITSGDTAKFAAGALKVSLD